jgi:hypothetical protein
VRPVTSRVVGRSCSFHPGVGYLPLTFPGDLAKLDKAGITPLCLGAKDPFTTTALASQLCDGSAWPYSSCQFHHSYGGVWG